MELIVKYKEGSTRRVNLTSAFFNHNLGSKTVDPGLSKKALDFAYDCGQDPYYVGVFRGTTVVFETHIRKNQPDESKQPDWIKIDESSVKKKLRKMFKNKPFTHKHVLQF